MKCLASLINQVEGRNLKRWGEAPHPRNIYFQGATSEDKNRCNGCNQTDKNAKAHLDPFFDKELFMESYRY